MNPQDGRQDDSTTFSAASRNTSVPNLETPGTGSISDRRATPGLLIPKNRSAGNLAAHASNSSPYSAQSQRARLSVDAGVDYDLARSPILTAERDTGLRRIRQARNPSSPNIPAFELRTLSTPAATSRKSSMNLQSGPASPVLPFSEDLTRFPSESLHSFSFAHNNSDTLQNRQQVLKRSIEFMRDKLGWASSSPRIASAQARLAGDEELLSMMELLQKANMMSPEAITAAGLGIDHGPLTGPAHLVSDNVFERSFVQPSEELVESPSDDHSSDTLGENTGPKGEVIVSPEDENEEPDPFRLSRSPTQEDAPSSNARPGLGRAALKRTYTDTSGLSLQHRLTEAMAQPYHTAPRETPIVPPAHSREAPQPGPSRANTMHERAPHGHRNNHPQAIFTTESKAPWTITAANDLACLIFGVTRAEVRTLGIMEVIREERRKWLEEKLRNPEAGTAQRQPKQPVSSPKAGPSNGSIAAMGNGVTAKLLSKPPARETYQSRRSKTENGDRSSSPKTPNHAGNRSRGVLLCGDVVPIKKMNGTYGSASLWVKEKSGGLIWVMEEIAEDVAYLTVDEIGSVVSGRGDIEPIWGIDRVRKGMDVQKLIPSFPKMAGTYTGALDYDEVARLRRFTVRTSNSISIPVTIDQLSGESTFRVSSFPHIAGIMVLNPRTMRVSSSNTVFSAALFGHTDPDGMEVTDLIPGFDKVLRIMTDEDKIKLVDGIVIPEHSFRRARSLLAMREGSAEAAQYFLRPSGLPAKHRDGADIMVDVQMRVVKSGRDAIYNESVIEEDVEGFTSTPSSEVVFALWITYSRQLHAVHHGIGSVTIPESRPTTPPSQPRPGSGIDESIPTPMANEESKIDMDDPRIALLSRQVEDAAASSDDSSPATNGENEVYEHPSPELLEAGCKVIKKKKIEDFNILEEMGQGAYGQVKLARYKKSAAKKMVIKYVTKRRILVDTWHRDRRLGTVPLEIHVLDYLRRDGLQHPNIVEMADFFEDDVNYYIEMVPHGLPGMDLFDYIELRVTMDERECRKIFKQVAEALRHLHIAAKVVHRDIKDENVILDGEGKVKLVDFGSAAYIKSGPFDVFVGTIDYAAPEVLQGRPYRGKEQDVWALGILLYTIVYKENPFYSIDEIMDHDLRVPWVPSEECIDLIRAMLDRDVERRVGIQAVLEHPWCTVVDDSDDEEGEGSEEADAALGAGKKAV